MLLRRFLIFEQVPTSTIDISKPYTAVWGAEKTMLITTCDGVLWQTEVPDLPSKTATIDPDTLRTAPLPLSGRGKFVRGNGK